MGTKEQVLAILEQHRGESISGADMAGTLKLSRNAVWKAVKELKKEGYRIHAAANKGYCLGTDNDILSVQGMLLYLDDESFAENISLYPSLESTNKTAKELAIAGIEHSVVIMAGYQTAGRGRFSRSFFSPSGHGIYMSFILLPAQWQWLGAPTLVTSYAAVSVCEAIEASTGKKPQIKWVNDVFLHGKKICGILSEAVADYESGGTQWIVVGIGINFTTPDDGFPEEIKHTAGSVFSQEKPTITRNRLAAEIVNRMLRKNNIGDSKPVLAEYKKRLMMLGSRVVVSGQRESFEATAIDIDDTGRLIVKKDNGETLTLSSGEVSLTGIAGAASGYGSRT